MSKFRPTDKAYEIQALEKIIAEITSGIKGAIPEQDDRDLAVRTLEFIERELKKP